MNKWLMLDTDILIDAGRGDRLALAYLEEKEITNILAIGVVTVMELFVGCANKTEQRAVDKFIERFEILLLTKEVSETAVSLLKRYRLSHGLLIADALIAATAIEYDMAFVSKNQKDYRFINELKLLPYPPVK